MQCEIREIAVVTMMSRPLIPLMSNLLMWITMSLLVEMAVAMHSSPVRPWVPLSPIRKMMIMSRVVVAVVAAMAVAMTRKLT